MTAPIDAEEAGRVDLSALQPGDHLCRVYENDTERMAVAAGFIRAGLAAGDRVLYVTVDPDPGSVRRTLLAGGVTVDRSASTGQLLLSSFGDVYASETVDFDGLQQGFRAAAHQARTDGFAGLRVAAELGDPARSFGSIEAVLEWEQQASDLQAEEGITSICQYDRAGLDEAAVASVVDVHHGIASARPVEPLADLRLTIDPWGLQVSGEIDISNRDQLERALRARLAARPEVCLDLSGVAFMDVGSIGWIFQLGREVPGTVRLVGVPTQVHRVIDACSIESPGVIVES